jgi:hypothetical protein
VHGALRVNTRSASLCICATGSCAIYSCFLSSDGIRAIGFAPLLSQPPSPLAPASPAAASGRCRRLFLAAGELRPPPPLAPVRLSVPVRPRLILGPPALPSTGSPRSSRSDRPVPSRHQLALRSPRPASCSFLLARPPTGQGLPRSAAPPEIGDRSPAAAPARGLLQPAARTGLHRRQDRPSSPPGPAFIVGKRPPGPAIGLSPPGFAAGAGNRPITAGQSPAGGPLFFSR